MRAGLALAAGAGLLHTAAFSPTEWWLLQPVALALLFATCHRTPPRQTAARAFAFAWAGLASGLWWLYISMHDFGHLPGPAAAAAVALLAAFLASYPALALGLAARFTSGPWRLPGLAAAWLLAELARASCFTGFPWIASGYAHTVGPLAGWAPWIGVYGITGVAALMAASLASLRVWGAVAFAAGLLGLALPQDFTTSTGSLKVSLVQPSIPQDQKFDLALFTQHQALLADLVARSQGQVVITPESVVPVPLVDLDPGFLDALAAHPSPVLLGAFLGDENSGYVNSMVAADRSYDYGKRHLLPFGEFIPTGFAWFVHALGIPLDNQATGQHQRAWAVGAQRLRPLICYEDLFGEDFVQSVVGDAAATVLVNTSNLAWFGTLMIQDQHLQFSQMRALEFQRPFVRATNTGATAVLDHRGRVTARMPPLERGVLEAEVEGRIGTTPYARWLNAAGLAPLWLVGLAGLALAAWGSRRARP